MPKIAALSLLAFLAGSTPQVHVKISPYETTITVPADVVDQHEQSPLTRRQWVMGNTLQAVPVFATGTDIGQVREELTDRNLSVLRESADFLIVREGIPLVDLSGYIREKYLYEFEDGRLITGPVTFSQAISKFNGTGLTEHRVRALEMFADADPDDPDPHNAFAWFLATHPDPFWRNPALAIRHAELAIQADEHNDWFYVDTLAAAYAAAGDFENAVRYQRQALAMTAEYDAGAAERLSGYENRQAYVADRSESDDTGDDGDEPEPTPKAEVVRRAVASDVEAQWSLGAFYVSHDIRQAGDVANPGAYWLYQAARNGHVYAANEIGYCYLLAICGLANDFPAAVEWFTIAANAGDEVAAYNLGRMLADGLGTTRDDIAATEWLTVAANDGNNAAAYSLLLRYREGIGTSRNFAMQRKYRQQIDAAGHTAADYLLTDAFFQQHYGASPIAAELERMDVRPEEFGDALLTLAEIIVDASATTADTFVVQFSNNSTVEYPTDFAPTLIFNLVRIAASSGSTDAQIKFAEIHERGDIAPRSMVEAYYWRQRASR